MDIIDISLIAMILLFGVLAFLITRLSVSVYLDTVYRSNDALGLVWVVVVFVILFSTIYCIDYV